MAPGLGPWLLALSLAAGPAVLEDNVALDALMGLHTGIIKKNIQLLLFCFYNTFEYHEERELFIELSGSSVGTNKLVFGSGTTLTVEPTSETSSVPQVIVIKSKKLEDDGSIGKAACLARNSYTKNISLEMSSNEVIYELNTPILTSEGLYNTIQVVNVPKSTEVTCLAKFNSSTITASTTLPEKEAEEPVTGKVCNTTDTSAQDNKVEKANMLSMAVLGLRVLLAKSVAFNTLMSIKLFLF